MSCWRVSSISPFHILGKWVHAMHTEVEQRALPALATWAHNFLVFFFGGSRGLPAEILSLDFAAIASLLGLWIR